jgi:hypothetical protein
MQDWTWFDYDSVARSRLTDYLTHDPQPGDFLTALISPMREIEEVFHVMLASLSINDATGVSLDAFGEMVNLKRLGLDDDSYRQSILNKRFANGGSGTNEDVKRVIRGLIGASNAVKIVAHRPAMFVAYVDFDGTVPANLNANVEKQSVAGVKPYVVQRVKGQGFQLAAAPSKPVNNILRVSPLSARNAMRVTPLTQNNAMKVNSRIISTIGSKFGSTLGYVASNNARYRTTRFSGATSE